MFFFIVVVRLFWAITFSSCLSGTVGLRVGYTRIPKPGGLVGDRVGVTGGVPIVKCLASSFSASLETLGFSVKLGVDITAGTR